MYPLLPFWVDTSPVQFLENTIFASSVPSIGKTKLLLKTYPLALILPEAVMLPNVLFVPAAFTPPWKDPVPLALTDPLISPLTKKWLKDPVALELIFPLEDILITSKADPDIPIPDNWLPSPIKAPLVLILPLAVIFAKAPNSNSLNCPIFPIMIPLELMSPDAVIPTACKCLHF